jgi:hypothetical protein
LRASSHAKRNRRADRLDHRAALGHRQRQGLFAIHILAGLGRGNGHESVPVLGRGDVDGVDVRPRENLAEIGRRQTTLVAAAPGVSGVAVLGLLAGGLALAVDRVAHRHDLRLAAAQEGPEMVVAAAAEPDAADGDALAGGCAAVHAERRARDDVRRRKGRCCAAEEPAPGALHGLFACHRKPPALFIVLPDAVALRTKSAGTAASRQSFRSSGFTPFLCRPV